MTRPPADMTLEQALAYQEGWGRTATRAHPHCTCGQTTDPPCPHCKADRDQPCRAVDTDEDTDQGYTHWQRPPAQAVPCPVHGDNR